MARTIPALLAAALCLSATAVQAQDAVAILTKAHRGSGPRTLQATMTMTLVDSSGKTTERKLVVKREGIDKQVVWFEEPADLRGTAFLRLFEEGVQKMWLYLPAFNKLERIGGVKMNRSFLGSDFSYADLAERDLEAYTHTYEGQEELRGIQAHKLVSSLKPDAPEDAAYGKIITWVDVASGRLLQEDLYDKKGDLIKRKIFSETRQIKDYVIPTVVEMVDLMSNHSTRITMSDVVVDERIPVRYFSTRGLDRLN